MIELLAGLVVYPGCEPYLKQLQKNLIGQTDHSFDLLIYNDGLNLDILDEFVQGLNMFDVYLVNNTKSKTPSYNRLKLILKAIELDYDLLVFFDADDQFSCDRIQSYIEGFDTAYDFFYNDLYNGSELFFEQDLPLELNSVEAIMTRNMVGLSHSALNLNKSKGLIDHLNLTSGIIAFDWHLYTTILFYGGRGKKVSGRTIYNLHDNNIAGSLDGLSKLMVRRFVIVKYEHYKALRHLGKDFDDLYVAYKELMNYVNDERALEEYSTIVNTVPPDYWWGNIKTLSELRSEGYV